MKLTVIGFTIFGLIIISCGHKERVPADVLSRSEMQQVLWDMLRADEYLTLYAPIDSLQGKKTESLQMYEEVFKLHHTNQKQFKKSIDFYKANPDLFKVVLDSMESQKRRILERIYRPTNIDTSMRRKHPVLQIK